MIIDLTRTFTEDMTVYPGSPKPELKQIASIDKDGYNVKLITVTSHTGTHMDAPNHMVPNTTTLDKLPVDHFIGKACVVVCQHGQNIDIDLLKKHAQLIEKADFVLFYSGWEHKWDTEDYLKDFPVLTEQAAKYLTEQNLKGIGLDLISVDPIDSQDMAIHKILLSHNLVIVENLTNLSMLPIDRVFDFMSLPIKILNADGAPARAIAMI